MNVSFAGCGFMGIYHIGVASCIKEYAPSLYQNKVAGASAGAICACALVCGCSLGDGTTEVLKLAVKARSRALGPLHPSFNLTKILRKGLENILPENAHEICSNRLFISLTRACDQKNVLVSKYYSKKDVIQAVICSSFIPFYSGCFFPKFHGRSYMDGSFSNNLPILDENTITVSPFCGECDICPQDENIGMLQVFLANTSINLCMGNLYRFGRILFPAHPDSLSDICKQGFDDALRFLHRNDLISCARCLELSSCIAVNTDSTDSGNNSDQKDEGCSGEPSTDSSDDSCRDCQTLRHVALIDNIPYGVSRALKLAADKLDKGYVNWFFNRKPVKILSLMLSPYILPIEIVYLAVIKIWSEWPQYIKDIWNNLNVFKYVVNVVVRYFNYERHRYSAKFSYELAITEIDKTEIKELLDLAIESFEVDFPQDNNQELKDVIIEKDDEVSKIMSEKILDSFSMNFNVKIPEDTVDGIHTLRNKVDIIGAIKATAPEGISQKEAAIDISQKALTFERDRLLQSQNFSSCEALDQAISIPEQSEAIFSYCYLDNDHKTVKITQIYNVNSMESKQAECMGENSTNFTEAINEELEKIQVVNLDSGDSSQIFDMPTSIDVSC